MTDFLRRYRTSRGFGVHSPLAYELITGPLRDRRVAYYCFDSVVTPRARRLVRLAARLGADSVAALGHIDPDIAGAAAQFSHGGNSRLLVVGSGADGGEALRASSESLLTAVYDMSLWKELSEQREGSEAFTDGREGFIVAGATFPELSTKSGSDDTRDQRRRPHRRQLRRLSAP